ncbi:hypothetical protein N7512_002221 [Penicillium capsulatum]|nr:hypothetical protein N7512_002221 [Penicillium capsulatum]
MEIAAWKLEDLEEKGAYDALRPDEFYAIGSLLRDDKVIGSGDIQLPPDDEMSTGDGMSIGEEMPPGNKLSSTGDEMFIDDESSTDDNMSIDDDYGCEQEVAIKVEYRGGYKTAEWLRGVAASGKNEHIVSVLAYGMLLGEEKNDDKAIIAYERLDQDAREAMRTNRLIDPLRLVKGLTLGLSEAFDLDIIHMDVKLENIMSYKRDKNTEWKVIDWDLRAKRQSMSTDYVGTRGYMAPEVYANRKKNTKPYIPERTMMFSFGMFLYNLWGIFHGKDGNPPWRLPTP